MRTALRVTLLAITICWRMGALAASLAFTHVAVVDVEHGHILRDRTVLIAGDRIRAIRPSATSRTLLPPGTRVVSSRGKYLIPGLWDMHVHAVRLNRPQWMFPLFLAYGVTGIRDTGSPLADLLHERAEVASGRVVGPRIFGTGPLLDGPGGQVPELTTVVDTPEHARRTVADLSSAGVDFIKVYNDLSREDFFAIMDEARRRGIGVIGHVPRAVTAIEASDAGLRSLEHLVRVPLACVPASLNEALRRDWEKGSARPGITEAELDALAVELRARRDAAFDEARCKEVGQRFARNGTWQVPTLELNRHWPRGFLAKDPAAADPRLRFVPKEVRAYWDGRRQAARASAPLPNDAEAHLYRLLVRTLRALHEAGAGILAGTDTDGNDANVFGIPGITLHREIEAFVQDAGFTPLEALRTATLYPARFLGKTDELGTVEVGRIADLVLLDANPLVDIRNARKVRAVVSNGRYFDRGALDAALAASQRRIDASPATAPAPR